MSSFNSNYDLIEQYVTNTISGSVINPLKASEQCTLINTKKTSYYIHTYDPTKMLTMLRLQKFNIDDMVLDKFVSEIHYNCCNVISISLYFTKCADDTMEKYLYSIYRSIKNVERNLPDWIVRVYLDISVYECINEKEKSSLIRQTFMEIINNRNVEVYTYNCSSFNDKTISIARTRTLRFLPLSDNDVNLCVIREADGVVSNLDCHNIKIFAMSDDKLFYLPNIIDHYRLIDDEYTSSVFGSYSKWLRYYKLIFEYDYFLNHQNICDLLAGIFSVKLKLKRDYYLLNVQILSDKINNFLLKINNNDKELHQLTILMNSFISTQFESDNDVTYNVFAITFNVGFDEILLLHIFKELISINKYSDGQNTNIVSYNQTQIETCLQLMFGPNIETVILDIPTTSTTIIEYLTNIHDALKKNNIISNNELILPRFNNSLYISGYRTIPNHDYNSSYLLYLIDSLLITIIYPTILNIIVTIPNNITFNFNTKYNMLVLLNKPYSRNYDIFYDMVYYLPNDKTLYVQNKDIYSKEIYDYKKSDIYSKETNNTIPNKSLFAYVENLISQSPSQSPSQSTKQPTRQSTKEQTGDKYNIINTNYYQKYQKYKMKYLKLKNN